MRESELNEILRQRSDDLLRKNYCASFAQILIRSCMRRMWNGLSNNIAKYNVFNKNYPKANR